MISDVATKHANSCIELLDSGKLEDALAYCSAQRVDPPQCSLTADSTNAHRLRVKAMEHLSNPIWWQKRLDTLAKRDGWMDGIKQKAGG